ncbi:hypothetical protein FIE12Z_1667 [Fusarium flagelliforme]|uniref:Fucose-specific lectin n=1 Tax=Fusarium flagelliforme TaxID=2675880 RepID=A0A395N281_9HYPO|nr:hypothetical protein FIE12Z_1667 [Fusarium flagelliforme]
MSSHVQHMTAVSLPDGNTILFQVNEKYEIVYYESQTTIESIPDAKKYGTDTLQIKNKAIKVNTELPVIAAVAFQHPNSCGGKAQVRVYYVDRDSLQLCELIRVGGNGENWQEGDVTSKQWGIAPTSGLTANVFQPSNDKSKFQIKVYYQRDNRDTYPDLAYNVVASGDDWSQRANITK